MSGVPTASAWNVLCGITRWALPLEPKMPRAQPAAGVQVRNLLVLDPGDVLDVRRPRIQEMRHLAGADDTEGDVRQTPRCLQDQLETVQRRRLADEQDVEVLTPMPGGPEETLFGAEVADRHLVDPSQLAHEVGVRLGICHDEVGSAESRTVETA